MYLSLKKVDSMIYFVPQKSFILNENITNQKLQDATKSVLKGKLVALNTCIRKKRNI